MTIEEMVSRYNIVTRDGKIGVMSDKLARKENMLDTIVAHKPEIIAYIIGKEEAKRKAAEERQAKINAIPGLMKIKAAREDWLKWREEVQESFESEGGGYVGVRPEPKLIEDSAEQFPQAHAYLKAEKYALKVNYELSSIGKKALERVINGDYVKAIEDMEKELKEYTNRHMWD
jgi:hypothetical protein